MEIKQSIVVSIQGNGTVDTKNGECNKWEIEMQNGDIGENLSKGDCKFKEGESATYQWHDGKYPKIKTYSEKPQTTQTTQKRGYDPALERKKQIMIVLQSSLKEANMFLSSVGYEGATKEQKLNELLDTMEIMSDRILKNKYLKNE